MGSKLFFAEKTWAVMRTYYPRRTMSDLDPIVVKVEDGRWDAFSIHSQPTERDQMLLATIREMGGVNENVAPGDYTFNIIPMIGGLGTAHLLPLEK